MEREPDRFSATIEAMKAHVRSAQVKHYKSGNLLFIQPPGSLELKINEKSHEHGDKNYYSAVNQIQKDQKFFIELTDERRRVIMYAFSCSETVKDKERINRICAAAYEVLMLTYDRIIPIAASCILRRKSYKEMELQIGQEMDMLMPRINEKLKSLGMEIRDNSMSIEFVEQMVDAGNTRKAA